MYYRDAKVLSRPATVSAVCGLFQVEIESVVSLVSDKSRGDKRYDTATRGTVSWFRYKHSK